MENVQNVCLQMPSLEEGRIHKSTKQAFWGIASSIDVYDCDPNTIRDAQKIKEFVVLLCDLIKMKRFGETQVVHFGEEERVAGFSMVQLIETSLISAHFANLTNTVYLDVFSCKPYDLKAIERFSRGFFKGKRCITSMKYRY
jgi:S-adenosylmethionine/arginine decarboxylase-like enzyme